VKMSVEYLLDHSVWPAFFFIRPISLRVGDPLLRNSSGIAFLDPLGKRVPPLCHERHAGSHQSLVWSSLAFHLTFNAFANSRFSLPDFFLFLVFVLVSLLLFFFFSTILRLGEPDHFIICDFFQIFVYGLIATVVPLPSLLHDVSSVPIVPIRQGCRPIEYSRRFVAPCRFFLR